MTSAAEKCIFTISRLMLLIKRMGKYSPRDMETWFRSFNIFFESVKRKILGAFHWANVPRLCIEISETQMKTII